MTEVITMIYESLKVMDNYKLKSEETKMEVMKSIKFKGLNHPLFITYLHGTINALFYESVKVEDYSNHQKYLFDKYIAENIKLYHDKTYEYYIKRDKYLTTLSRQLSRYWNVTQSRQKKISKCLSKINLYSDLIDVVRQQCYDEILITKHVVLLKIDVYCRAVNEYLRKELTYDKDMFDECIEYFKDQTIDNSSDFVEQLATLFPELKEEIPESEEEISESKEVN